MASKPFRRRRRRRGCTSSPTTTRTMSAKRPPSHWPDASVATGSQSRSASRPKSIPTGSTCSTPKASMTDKTKAEAFVKLPRDLIDSDAWRALGINARRFLDFLMIEHMRHGGRANGKLLAPRRQIERFGIGSHFVSGAIEEAEHLGFVDCKRGVGRQPSL